MKKSYIQIILFMLVFLVASSTIERPTGLNITLPEGHRAYEWEWTVKLVRLRESLKGELPDWAKTVKEEITEKLGAELDEKGTPVQIIGEPTVI